MSKGVMLGFVITRQCHIPIAVENFDFLMNMYKPFFLCDAPTVCMTTLDAQAGSIGYRFVRGDHRDEFVQTPSAEHMSRAPNVDSHTRRARLGRLSQRPYRRWSFSYKELICLCTSAISVSSL